MEKKKKKEKREEKREEEREEGEEGRGFLVLYFSEYAIIELFSRYKHLLGEMPI